MFPTAAVALILAKPVPLLAAPLAGAEPIGRHESPSPGRKGLVSKHPWDQSQEVVIPLESRETSICMRDCVIRNQMMDVGLERIEEACRKSCGEKDGREFNEAPLRAGDRNAYIRALSDTDDPRVVPLLIPALEREFHERTGLWAWIIPALGRLRDPRAVPVLIEALEIEDEHWLGRVAAAKALGRIGHRSAVPALLRAADRGDTREVAIDALATLGDPRGIEVLIEALALEEAPETRKAAAAGLKALGASAVPAMIQAFRVPFEERESLQSEQRLSLCRLLAESEDPRALRALRSGRQDPDPRVAACARRFTGNFPEPSDAGPGR